ncbi:Tn3 family resolvase [Pseudomonas sp. FW305-20]|nr:Tn3 family resolvase [Pseudomonas sp. FW305-20]PMU19454.1 Tn3 family resolvase [Pseudomonas sp. FW305-122]PMU38569.1 Tn3 family resolvase [Pseudomonas sp. FW305-47B]PMX59442.1 Tn3 family resolvase [Pseudomonas sp. FW305-33]PMX69448.1 Tn3 family resolvase [Pseudomonas sp. FW305-60]
MVIVTPFTQAGAARAGGAEGKHMTSASERYLQAARRESTIRRYKQALEHYEIGWGGFLPASSESIVRYLAEHAGLSISTLRSNLAALARWHLNHGFVDPTKAPQVRDVLRGIQALHPRQVRQAEPLQLRELEQCVAALQQEVASPDLSVRLRASRDRALLLLGFWRAFRSDDLCRLRIETSQLVSGEGLSLFLSSSKTDRDHQGRTVSVPALIRLCPVQAYEDWLTLSQLRSGPVFRSIDRWGHLGPAALHPYSVARVLRRALTRGGVAGERYSGHSLRRGFATWATRNQWSPKALMEYVGWRDVHSALRYVEADAPFGNWRREDGAESK